MLRLGFEKILDQSLHLDGTIGVGGGTSLANKAINGLDFIVPCVSHTGTVGGIARAGNTYWRNQIDMGAGLNVTTGTAYGNGYPGDELLAPMQTMWRACQKNGGSPNFILAGTDFITSYEAAVDAKLSRYAVQPGTAQSPWNMDASLEIKDSGTFTGLFFQGVPIIWDPVFEDLDGITGAKVSNGLTVDWSKRCYFLNTNHLTLRPIPVSYTHLTLPTSDLV